MTTKIKMTDAQRESLATKPHLEPVTNHPKGVVCLDRDDSTDLPLGPYIVRDDGRVQKPKWAATHD